MARTDDRMEGRRVMTPDEIAADRAVIDAATDGPWTAIGQGVVHDTGACNCGPGGLNGMHEPYCGAGLLADASVDDAAFIAAARTGWPRALDALEAAWAEVERFDDVLWKKCEEKVDAEARAEQAEAEVARLTAALALQAESAENAAAEVARLREREARVEALRDRLAASTEVVGAKVLAVDVSRALREETT